MRKVSKAKLENRYLCTIDFQAKIPSRFYNQETRLHIMIFDTDVPNRSSSDFSVGPRILAFREESFTRKATGLLLGAKAVAVAARRSGVATINFILNFWE